MKWEKNNTRFSKRILGWNDAGNIDFCREQFKFDWLAIDEATFIAYKQIQIKKQPEEPTICKIEWILGIVCQNHIGNVGQRKTTKTEGKGAY